jgi:hypothetical protein
VVAHEIKHFPSPCEATGGTPSAGPEGSLPSPSKAGLSNNDSAFFVPTELRPGNEPAAALEAGAAGSAAAHRSLGIANNPHPPACSYPSTTDDETPNDPRNNKLSPSAGHAGPSSYIDGVKASQTWHGRPLFTHADRDKMHDWPAVGDTEPSETNAPKTTHNSPTYQQQPGDPRPKPAHKGCDIDPSARRRYLLRGGRLRNMREGVDYVSDWRC